MKQYAQIIMQDDTPRSVLFDDIYFCPRQGIAESRYHFIEGNQLDVRFEKLISQWLSETAATSNKHQINHVANECDVTSACTTVDDRPHLSPAMTIVETGFGTGLNFLLTSDLWQNTCDRLKGSLERTSLRDIQSYEGCGDLYKTSDNALNASCGIDVQEDVYSGITNNHPILHYISVEKYPIHLKELKEIYTSQSWDMCLVDPLLDMYPETFSQRVYEFSFGHVRLTLLLGDVTDCLQTYPFMADGWFLDGFAPNKNPDMWTQTLFDLMAQKSHRGTTFATFTAAGIVRRGLIQAGFHVSKTKGFGKKRERLVGWFG
ncbi:MAG: tRNA (5-methylaminomethyl-2-thiouridine)(34)-methyltransferase MnmD [Alcaligenaceae bacterium]|nr:tRNA (5-methylaminomethyl-2-thiouridine)(34)-methyltransferase MnmD [Alcaligenaceae bacterium]